MTPYRKYTTFCWLIILGSIFLNSLILIKAVNGNIKTVNEEIIDLKIQSTLMLDTEPSKTFDRSFAISKKHDIYLIHIKCQTTENNIVKVTVDATVNGIRTKKAFWDSSQNNSAPHSFFAGTILTLQLKETSPIYYLFNSLNLTIQIETSSYFKMEKGNFAIEETSLQALTPPTITPDSQEEMFLPLEIAQGEWYIPPLSLLSERVLQTPIFIYITHKLVCQIQVEVIPIALPPTTLSFTILSGQKTFQNSLYTANELKTMVFVEVDKGERLTLELRFRPTAETKNKILKFTIDATASVTSFPSNKITTTSSFLYDFLPLHLNFLELLRISCLIIPLFVFYKRRKHAITDGQPVIIENTSGKEKNDY